MSLAWESVTPVPCLSLWERWPSAARTERANKEGPPPGGPSFSLSINPLYGVRGSFTQGELEGAKPASNRIKCRAKPCYARRAWSTPRVLALRREATIFVPQGGTKITTLFQDALRQPPFRPYSSSIFRGCQDKRRVFKHFTAAKASWSPASPRRAARAHGGWTVGRSDAGDGWGGYCISVFHGKFTSFELKSHIFCCELLTFWLFCSVI